MTSLVDLLKSQADQLRSAGTTIATGAQTIADSEATIAGLSVAQKNLDEVNRLQQQNMMLQYIRDGQLVEQTNALAKQNAVLGMKKLELQNQLLVGDSINFTDNPLAHFGFAFARPGIEQDLSMVSGAIQSNQAAMEGIDRNKESAAKVFASSLQSVTEETTANKLQEIAEQAKLAELKARQNANVVQAETLKNSLSATEAQIRTAQAAERLALDREAAARAARSEERQSQLFDMQMEEHKLKLTKELRKEEQLRLAGVGMQAGGGNPDPEYLAALQQSPDKAHRLTYERLLAKGAAIEAATKGLIPGTDKYKQAVESVANGMIQPTMVSSVAYAAKGADPTISDGQQVVGSYLLSKLEREANASGHGAALKPQELASKMYQAQNTVFNKVVADLKTNSDSVSYAVFPPVATLDSAPELSNNLLYQTMKASGVKMTAANAVSTLSGLVDAGKLNPVQAAQLYNKLGGAIAHINNGVYQPKSVGAPPQIGIAADGLNSDDVNKVAEYFTKQRYKFGQGRFPFGGQ